MPPTWGSRTPSASTTSGAGANVSIDSTMNHGIFIFDFGFIKDEAGHPIGNCTSAPSIVFSVDKRIPETAGKQENGEGA